MSESKRADLLLVELGLAESRTRAQALILAGRVYSDQVRIEKAGTRLAPGTTLTVTESLPYVGRGGLKLAAALDRFGVDPLDKVCLDVGASTGGFTDCLLQRGARRVYAVDVGYGQLDWNLRNDQRVTVMERTNFRNVDKDALPHDLDLAVVDVSFISLRLILPRLRDFLGKGAEAVLLVKPQFEVGRGKVGKGGIVRDGDVREEALEGVLEAAVAQRFVVAGRMESPVRGAGGNVEYLVHLKWSGEEA
ncbi:MAG: TlyA family RNA methyltransferase [bacterium]|nr:TlyA family RNA methyltransferase [bacterium]